MDGPVLIIPKAEKDEQSLISDLIEEIIRLRNNEKKYEKIIDELTEKVKNMDEEIKNLKQ
jgi:phage shock protein A